MNIANKMSNTRTDGRVNNEARPLEITTDYTMYAEGAVLTSSGNTKIICTASVENKVPDWLLDKDKKARQLKEQEKKEQQLEKKLKEEEKKLKEEEKKSKKAARKLKRSQRSFEPNFPRKKQLE